MRALSDPRIGADMAKLLLEHGANVQCVPGGFFSHQTAVGLAVASGDPDKVNALLEFGGTLDYRHSGGYNAVLDAVHGRDVFRDQRLTELLKLLIAHGVDLNCVSSYQESVLRVLSNIGRFDAVKLLLEAGADEAQLGWSPLLRAVALGEVSDMARAVDAGAGIEERDWWERTPSLLAVQTGDTAKVEWLRERGADLHARGRCQKPPAFYAIECDHVSMLEWLIAHGIGLDEVDQFGTTSLRHAVEQNSIACVDVLLKHGADVNVEDDGQTALSFVQTREVAMRLLDAGADPQFLPYEGRRALLGFEPEPDATLLDVTADEFQAGRSRRFGLSNPELFHAPFLEGMIRAGINAYQAAQLFEKEVEGSKTPVWCAQRFGQSITFLPDGRCIQIAGEHEDGYDPDFCIYNDVFEHLPDGSIRIYGYPEDIFPPTDFHTATLVGDAIYLIGSLGYHGQRRYDETPVYRLDTRTFVIQPVSAKGENPGWIYRHRARLRSAHEIQISSGTILVCGKDEEVHVDNEETYVLDLRAGVWRIEATAHA
jgi:ankyrin repeat protein